MQPSSYFACQSEHLQTRDASDGVGAPHFDVHVPGQVAIKPGPKVQVAWALSPLEKRRVASGRRHQ